MCQKVSRENGLVLLRGLTAGAGLLLLSILLTSCSRGPVTARMGAMGMQRTLDVAVVQPTQIVVTNWEIYPAYLQAVHSVQIKAQVGGYLQEIHFRDGQFVSKGDLLFVIDPRPYEAALERARAERIRSEVAWRQAKDDLERAQRLQGTGAISAEELDRRTKAVAAAEAALAAAKAAEQQAALNLEYTRITAPVDGRIGQRLVSLGDYIQAGMMGTVMASLVTVDPIYVVFEIPEDAFLRYQRLVDNLTNLTCQVRLSIDEDFQYTGHIDFYDNQVERQTGTVRMRGVLDNKQGRLMPGLYCQVRISIGDPESGLAVPAIAVLNRQGRDFVYIVNADNKVELRPVVAGPLHGHLRLIRSGISANDRVAVGRLLMLRPGMTVEPKPASESDLSSVGALN